MRNSSRRVLPEPTEKRCTQCGQVKPASEFYRSSSHNYQLSAACSACQIAKAKAQPAYLKKRAGAAGSLSLSLPQETAE